MWYYLGWSYIRPLNGERQPAGSNSKLTAKMFGLATNTTGSFGLVNLSQLSSRHLEDYLRGPLGEVLDIGRDGVSLLHTVD